MLVLCWMLKLLYMPPLGYVSIKWIPKVSLIKSGIGIRISYVLLSVIGSW